eukprot:4521027-Prymnesium_polylepis.2
MQPSGKAPRSRARKVLNALSEASGALARSGLSRKSRITACRQTSTCHAQASGTAFRASVDFLSLARQGQLTSLRELLGRLDEAGRRDQLTAEDASGNTALLLAIEHEYPNVVAMLLQFAEVDPLHQN